MRHLIDIDILPRFTAIYSALRKTDDWRNRREWLRFAAQLAVLCPLEPAESAKRIRVAADILKRDGGWFSDLRSPWRFVVAALLVQDGIAAEDFAAGLSADHERLRQAGLRPGGLYGTMAVAILRHLGGGKLDTIQIAKFAQLYDGLKAHHWWLTGPDDFPACACLTAVTGETGVLSARIEANLERLRGSGFTTGNHLLHAACLLALPDLPNGVAVVRFSALAQTIATRHGSLWHEDYDALAILCLLDHEPAIIVERISDFVKQLTLQEPTLQGQATFNLAADLTFLDLARCDRRGFRLHKDADLEHMVVTLRIGSAASLLLSTSATSVATVEVAEWPTVAPLGMSFP